MKIYISTDMEGIAGVTDYKEITPSHPRYQASRRWLTENVNAAVEGAIQAGAKDVLISDGHGGVTNIIFEEMHPKAKIYKGRVSRPLYSMAGMDNTFDAVFFVGFHARLGQRGVLSHTFNNSQGFIELKVNGRPVGEAELAAAVAGTCGVPVALGVGDDCFCAEMREWNPGAELVEVKKAITWQDAICLSLEEANQRIREAASKALTKCKEIQPFTFDLPLTLELECANDAIASMISFMPGVQLVGHRTVIFESPDYMSFYAALQAMISLQLVAIYPDLAW